MRLPLRSIGWFCAVAAALVGRAGRADVPLASFTPGNLVLMRGGDQAHPQSSYAGGQVPAYLDEYSVSGGVASYVGTYTIPSTTLTLPGINTNSHEGRLNLSGDGHYLDFVGYQQAVSPTIPRVIDGTGTGTYYQLGQVSGGGSYTGASLDTSVATPQFVRSAYSDNGSQAWIASKNPNGGLEYLSGLGGATTTVALQTNTDWRDLKVAAGQLYGGTGSSSVGVHGFYAIGTGEPIAATPANTLLSNSGNNSVSGFAMVSLPAGSAPAGQPINGVSGPNTAYVVGDPSGNAYIGKLYSPDGSPALTTSNLPFASRLVITSQIPGPEGIVAKTDPQNPTWVDLYVVAADGVYFAVDTSGTATGDFGALTFSKIISSFGTGPDAVTNFYGIAHSPSQVPEPASVVTMVIGTLGLALYGWRRARR